MVPRRVKAALRSSIAAPGIRHGLRWFINEPRVPAPWRDLAHRKLAKRARFGRDTSFVYQQPDGPQLRFAHVGTANYLYWLNEYEPETTSLFCQLARSATTILDIGAADGIYSVLAAATNPEARILAFEPGEAAARTCARNIALNQPLTKHVELHALALAEYDGTATLYVAGESGGTSSMNASFRRDRSEQPVTVRTGDALLREQGIAHIDLIKIDTESTEPAVLRGLASRLQTDRPDVICEVLADRNEHELQAQFEKLAYRFFAVTSDGLVARTTLVADPSYRTPNYLFTRRTADELSRLGLRVTS